MTQKLKNLLDQAGTWSEEEQNELMEYAREIEARRTGVYIMTDDERAAVEAGKKSRLLSDKEMEVFWKRYGVI